MYNTTYLFNIHGIRYHENVLMRARWPRVRDSYSIFLESYYLTTIRERRTHGIVVAGGSLKLRIKYNGLLNKQIHCVYV